MNMVGKESKELLFYYWALVVVIIVACSFDICNIIWSQFTSYRRRDGTLFLLYIFLSSLLYFYQGTAFSANKWKYIFFIFSIFNADKCFFGANFFVSVFLMKIIIYFFWGGEGGCSQLIFRYSYCFSNINNFVKPS